MANGARLALAILGVPVVFVAFVFAAVTLLGYGDSGAYNPAGTFGEVVMMLIIALALPVGVSINGILAARSTAGPTPRLVRAAVVVSVIVAIGAIATIGPMVGSTASDAVRRQQAINEQDDLSPIQLSEKVKPVFEATINTLGGEKDDFTSHGGRCDTPSHDAGFGYDTSIELPYDGDAEKAERAVREVWEHYGFDVEPGGYGIRTESSGPVWMMELATFPHTVQFTLTSTCVIDPSLN